MSTSLSHQAINTHFESIFPELESRLTALSKRFAEPDEARSEMLAASWLNHQSKARRTGELLPASLLAHFAWRRHLSGRVQCGYSTRDVLAPQTFRANRARVVSFAQLSTSKLRHRLDDKTAARVTQALCSSEHERPPVLVARKLDWLAFAVTLPWRLRKILTGLSVGESKTALAKALGISPGRLSQLLDVLAQRIREFFGDENLPDCCAA